VKPPIYDVVKIKPRRLVFCIRYWLYGGFMTIAYGLVQRDEK